MYGDTYLNVELSIPRDSDGPEFSCVKRLLRDNDGPPNKKAINNPILDKHMYEVGYLDGNKSTLAVNGIAENMFAQVDDEDNRQILFEEIIDPRNY